MHACICVDVACKVAREISLSKFARATILGEEGKHFLFRSWASGQSCLHASLEAVMLEN